MTSSNPVNEVIVSVILDSVVGAKAACEPIIIPFLRGRLLVNVKWVEIRIKYSFLTTPYGRLSSLSIITYPQSQVVEGIKTERFGLLVLSSDAVDVKRRCSCAEVATTNLPGGRRETSNRAQPAEKTDNRSGEKEVAAAPAGEDFGGPEMRSYAASPAEFQGLRDTEPRSRTGAEPMRRPPVLLLPAPASH